MFTYLCILYICLLTYVYVYLLTYYTYVYLFMYICYLFMYMFTYLRVYLLTYVRILICSGKISISFWKVLIVWSIWCLFRSIIKILWKLLVSSELKSNSYMCLFVNFVKLLIGEWLDVNYLYTKFSKWLSKWIVFVRK